MRRFSTLLGREVSHYFHQPLAYVVLFCFLLLTAFNFHTGLSALNRETGPTTMVEAFFNSILFWFPLVLIFPLLTMRLFSEEYKLGTIESLMTAPVRDWQVVLAKFLGAVVFYVVLWTPTVLYFVLFGLVADRPAATAVSSYFGAYGIVLLVGLFYLAIGCLASALTQNQIVAAIVAYALICGMFFLNLLALLFPSTAPFLQELTYYFATTEHMAEFSRGLLDSRPVVFYLSMTAFTLFLTLHVFQYRRWKK
jgi:ABC-2 type transport system permease protein